MSVLPTTALYPDQLINQYPLPTTNKPVFSPLSRGLQKAYQRLSIDGRWNYLSEKVEEEKFCAKVDDINDMDDDDDNDDDDDKYEYDGRKPINMLENGRKKKVE